MAGITYRQYGIPDNTGGPNQLMSGHMFTERTPEAQVVQNCATRDGEANLKERNTRSSPNHVLDMFTGNMEDINFHAGDVAVGYRGDITKPRDEKSPGERKPRVFASFTGEKIPAGWSQEQFDAQFVFYGFAKTTFSYNDLNQPENGIAVRIGGAGTTRNNGSKTFRPMDWIKARVPSIDPAQRAKDNLNRPTKGYSPPTKQTPILEPYTMTDMFVWLEEAIDWYFNNVNEDQCNYSRICSERLFNGKTNVGMTQEMSLGFVRWAVHNMLAGVALLENMGLINFNKALLEEMVTNPERYAEYVTKFESTNNLVVLSREKWNNSKKDFEEYTNKDLSTEFAGRNSCMRAIAALFGALLPEHDQNSMRYSKHAVEALVMRVYYPVLKDPALVERGSVVHYLGGHAINKRKRNNLAQLALDTNVVKSLSMHEKGAFGDLMLSLCQSRLVTEEKILGRALGQSGSKEFLDYVRY